MIHLLQNFQEIWFGMFFAKNLDLMFQPFGNLEKSGYKRLSCWLAEYSGNHVLLGPNIY